MYMLGSALYHHLQYQNTHGFMYVFTFPRRSSAKGGGTKPSSKGDAGKGPASGWRKTAGAETSTVRGWVYFFMMGMRRRRRRLHRSLVFVCIGERHIHTQYSRSFMKRMNRHAFPTPMLLAAS